MIHIQTILNDSKIQKLINNEDFYFQKAQDQLNEWLNLEISESLKQKILEIYKDYNLFQEEANQSKELQNILELLFKIIAYCDVHAKDKNTYNQYDDKRVLAKAQVRMNAWVEGLVRLKFLPETMKNGSPKNAFNYLQNPENHTTILSENHRKEIIENLCKDTYEPENFTEDLKEFFQQYNLNTKNSKNYTRLLSKIIYENQSLWQKEVIGLMASDTTGWQNDYIQKMQDYKAGVVWNSKRPTGKGNTLAFLRNIVNDGESFYLYYGGGGLVHYRAKVIDFVESQAELKKAKWEKEYGSIYDYSDDFEEYNDGTKYARIIFLIESIEKIEPIPISQFKFYGNAQAPRQDNLSPIAKKIDETPKMAQKDTNQKNNIPLNQILFGPPGTGKTYDTIEKSLEIVGIEKEDKTREELKELFDEKVAEGQIVFTTFHQSMSYEDFIEGIKPETQDGRVVYEVKNGIFKQLCLAAQTPNLISFEEAYQKFQEDLSKQEQIILKTPTNKEFKVSLNSNNNLNLYTGQSQEKQGVLTKENIQKQINGEKKFIGWEGYFKGVLEYLKTHYNYSDKAIEPKNYVIIIDEINRGNVAAIFGELITLIEDSKRMDEDETLEVILPYSKEKFAVPNNVYIIGTMNTADRSVEALDTALRRRFSFTPMPSKPELIKQKIKIEDKNKEIDLEKMLRVINERIEKLIDKDHQIGHSYFLEAEKEQDLKNTFKNKIIPLLEEYFFGDYGKIGLVLGDSFVESSKINNGFKFAQFSGYDNSVRIDLETRIVYKIQEENSWKFEEIYQ